MNTLGEQIPSKMEKDYRMLENFSNMIRVAIPAIIQSFDAVNQTVTAQIAIKERIIDKNGNLTFVEIAPLVDVPISIPKAGGYSLTLPITAGDECLLVFNDMCIDSWFSYGGVQSWIDKRRHDLSDAVAIIGISSEPTAIENYSVNSAQLRNETGTAYVEIKGEEVNIVGTLNINGHPYLEHKHTNVQSGAGISGGVQSGT